MIHTDEVSGRGRHRRRALAVALLVPGLVLLAGPGTGASAAESAEICTDIMGCPGGDAKCADYRTQIGNQYISGSCYGDLHPT